MSHARGSLLSGILLVAGTSIGGGMLALPVLTAYAGFVPSLVAYFFCWLFMMSTGLLFLEISLLMPERANIISMSERMLGPLGKALSWILYLFLFNCLMVAYTVGCGDFLVDIFLGGLPPSWAPVLVVFCLAPLLYVGTRLISRVNNLLMMLLCASFMGFVFFGISASNRELLLRRDWSFFFSALPIAFTSFAYQGIIPTLVTYLDRDVAKIRKSIIIGSFATLVTYFIWQGIIQGVVPVDGANGLAEALAKGDNAVVPLQYYTDAPIVSTLGIIFAFTALVTSFFGVALGLIDFFADGFAIEKTPRGKLVLCALCFIPALLISYTHPYLFLSALEVAGGYGCALLLGVLPIAMVWSARYRLHMQSPYTFPGGKAALLFLLSIVSIELLFLLKSSLY
jgi:tyrosine-specific transport protein